MNDHDLFLGRDLLDGSRVGLDPDHLTTHAVCVGMTGSGKTGLGIVALEELARRGVPLLVVDLKGDMVDLLLNFPALEPADFEPWLTSDMVAGRDRTVVAGEQAALWRQGLERTGLGTGDVAAVRERRAVAAADARALVAVAPVDILPSLAAPRGGAPERRSRRRDRTGRWRGGCAAIARRTRRRSADRSATTSSWRRYCSSTGGGGNDLDLAGLLASLADPPMDSLGVLPLERFFPRKDRLELVMELNALVASPVVRVVDDGCAAGHGGAARRPTTGRARASSASPIWTSGSGLSSCRCWCRSWCRGCAGSPGTGSLRALLYIDEVQGILPPHPANPPTKTPLLTVLKQGRAFGVGAWLATQNPVDLDYKALGNAGVTLIGRLVTERDRERGPRRAGPAVDSRTGATPTASSRRLGKREFLLHDVRAESAPAPSARVGR